MQGAQARGSAAPPCQSVSPLPPPAEPSRGREAVGRPGPADRPSADGPAGLGVRAGPCSSVRTSSNRYGASLREDPALCTRGPTPGPTRGSD